MEVVVLMLPSSSSMHRALKKGKIREIKMLVEICVILRKKISSKPQKIKKFFFREIALLTF